jgi:transcriptional repressor NrdR
MQCPRCNTLENRVIDSRLTDKNRAIRRRRECEKCGFRFTTIEQIRIASLIVIKKDGTREPYDRQKIENGIWKSCEKRPVTQRQVAEAITELEEKWNQVNEIPSQQLGEGIMEKLRDLDEVAYIRFASVYRQFKDIASFEKELKKIRQEE